MFAGVASKVLCFYFSFIANKRTFWKGLQTRDYVYRDQTAYRQLTAGKPQQTEEDWLKSDDEKDEYKDIKANQSHT